MNSQPFHVARRKKYSSFETKTTMPEEALSATRMFAIEHPKLRPSIWAQNRHVQTLAAFFLPKQNSTRLSVQRMVHMSDGDRLIIHDDSAKSWITGDRIAILVHGLCGSHESSYVRRTAIRLRRHGIRTIRIDMRGFGKSELISRGHLHAGRCSDLLDVINFVEHLSPLSKVSLIGFSLGANIVLKLLARWANANPTQVDSAIAVSPPIDLQYCSANLRLFGNRFYEHYFLKRLVTGLIYRRRHVQDLNDNGMNPMPDRLVHFDDQFTALVNGFSGARDYYSSCSTVDDLNQIDVPTVIVAAEDDPVVPFELFDPGLFSTQTEFVHTKHGGHLGFLGTQPRDPDHHWLDWRICKWLSSLEGG